MGSHFHKPHLAFGTASMCVYRWRVAAPVSVCSEIPSFPQRLCTREEEAIEMMKIWLRQRCAECCAWCLQPRQGLNLDIAPGVKECTLGGAGQGWMSVEVMSRRCVSFTPRRRGSVSPSTPCFSSKELKKMDEGPEEIASYGG